MLHLATFLKTEKLYLKNFYSLARKVLLNMKFYKFLFSFLFSIFLQILKLDKNLFFYI